MRTLNRALLTLRTVRHLTASQLVHRLLRPMRRRLTRPVPLGTIEMRAIPPGALLDWYPHSSDDAASLLNGTVSYFGISERIEPPLWTRRPHSPLWTYHLHYGSWATSLALAFRQSGDRRFIETAESLMLQWITATAGRIGPGWEPYPTACRIQHWIRALIFAGPANLSERGRTAVLKSLGEQVQCLRANIEYELGGNHVQRDLAALALAELSLSGTGVESVLRGAVQTHWRELGAQVLADGCHAERSAMYHAHALGDALEIAAVLRATGQPLPDDARQLLARMTAALQLLVRPNDEPHRFNDCAAEEAPSRTMLLRMSSEVLDSTVEPPRPFALPDGGYYGFADEAARLVVDCGPLGPAHQPGHGHSDLLSFELDIEGVPVIVNAGTSGYDLNPRRSHERSAWAHSTVGWADGDQAELWATFRVARRPALGRVVFEPNPFAFSGRYRPYFDPSIEHSREIERTGPHEILVTDQVRGALLRALGTVLHIHPRWTVERCAHSDVMLSDGSLRLRISAEGLSEVRMSRGNPSDPLGWWSPRMGETVPATTLLWQFASEGPMSSRFRIALIQGGPLEHASAEHSQPE